MPRERIGVFGDGGWIVTDEVAGTVLRTSGEREPAAVSGTTGLDETLDKLEIELIVNALRATRGNKAKAARLLGVTERVMGLRVKKYGIDFWAFRSASSDF